MVPGAGAGRGAACGGGHARGSQTLEFNERTAAPPHHHTHSQGTMPRARGVRLGGAGVGAAGAGAARRGAGWCGLRLDLLGRGVGRIERHLSSSCGTIDLEQQALQLVLLQRCPPVPGPAPPPPPAAPPLAPPRPSCSYHLLPESHRAPPPPHLAYSHASGGGGGGGGTSGARACCEAGEGAAERHAERGAGEPHSDTESERDSADVSDAEPDTPAHRPAPHHRHY